MCYSGDLYLKNTARVLIISQVKNIVPDALSLFTNNKYQETTHESTYTTETMSEIYYIKELPDGTFPLSFKLVDHYQ